MGTGASSEKIARDLHRRARRRFGAEEKIRIILDKAAIDSMDDHTHYRWHNIH